MSRAHCPARGIPESMGWVLFVTDTFGGLMLSIINAIENTPECVVFVNKCVSGMECRGCLRLFYVEFLWENVWKDVGSIV